MKPLALAAALMVAGAAHADRIFTIPTATKVLYRQARIEIKAEPGNSDRREGLLAVGVTPEIEVEMRLLDYENRPILGTFDASFQYLVPVVDTTPGISVGVQDALDRTAQGRMYFLAFTLRFALDGAHNQRTPMELTMGAGFGRRNGLYTGVTLPFTWQFRALAEYDLRRPAVGFEYLTHQGLSARVQFDREGTMLSARYVVKF